MLIIGKLEEGGSKWERYISVQFFCKPKTALNNGLLTFSTQNKKKKRLVRKKKMKRGQQVKLSRSLYCTLGCNLCIVNMFQILFVTALKINPSN